MHVADSVVDISETTFKNNTAMRTRVDGLSGDEIRGAALAVRRTKSRVSVTNCDFYDNTLLTNVTKENKLY